MSTIVFISQKVPDKKLIAEHIYKYQPDSVMKEQIVKDLETHLKGTLPDNMIIELNIQVILKEYDTIYHPTDKNQCYQEYSNTKTEG